MVEIHSNLVDGDTFAFCVGSGRGRVGEDLVVVCLGAAGDEGYIEQLPGWELVYSALLACFIRGSADGRADEGETGEEAGEEKRRRTNGGAGQRTKLL